jgi:hypothetical protein
MSDVGNSLQAMGAEQYLLAFVFLASYALAIGGFIGERGRRVAACAALLAAIIFAMLTDPWEQGVMLVTFALVGMGLFTGAAWGLWAVLTRGEARASNDLLSPPGGSR